MRVAFPAPGEIGRVFLRGQAGQGEHGAELGGGQGAGAAGPGPQDEQGSYRPLDGELQ